jgi:hypothetical protein
MGSQDRFLIDHAATRAASPLLPKKDTSHKALFWARGTSDFSALVVGGGLFMGLYPENGINADFFHLALPFIAPPVVGTGFAVGWHHWLGVCAHDAPLRKHIIALCAGVALTGAGIGLSGANLAAMLGGEKAIKTYQQQNITKFAQETEVVEGNISAEAPLLAGVEHSSQALRITAEGENNRSVVRKTKPGKGPTYNSISDAADDADKTANTMRQQAATRDGLLATARASIEEARRASEAGDSDKFENAYGRAATALSSADKIHLSATASNLFLGLALDRAAAGFVNGVSKEVNDIRQNVNANWRPVAVPNYQRISEHEAVRRNPGSAFLAWLTAILVECVPLSFMPLLLTLWRSEDNDQEPPASGNWPVPLYAPPRDETRTPTHAAAE